MGDRALEDEANHDAMRRNVHLHRAIVEAWEQEFGDEKEAVVSDPGSPKRDDGDAQAPTIVR